MVSCKDFNTDDGRDEVEKAVEREAGEGRVSRYLGIQPGPLRLADMQLQ
jgi:hypothetical protein